MSSTPVCVDASFVVKLLAPEANSERAERLWAGRLKQDVQILAPVLLAFEVPSVLRKQVQRGLLSQERGQPGLLDKALVQMQPRLSVSGFLSPERSSLNVRRGEQLPRHRRGVAGAGVSSGCAGDTEQLP